jgi:hypothetical protein
MALNLSSTGNSDRISFGAGVLRIGPAGFTPSTDIGYIRTAQLSVTRQKLEVFLGFPRTLIVQYVNQEDVVLNCTGIEWSLDRLKDAFASGNVSGTKLRFGGDVNLAKVALEFEHQMPAGGTATIRIWKAQGQGEVQLNLGEEVHEFPYAFRALDAATNWASVANPSDGRLMEIELIGVS